MQLAELLKNAGFSDKEIAVYVAMNALGPAVVSDIASQAGINRSTAYVILDVLTKRQLVSATEGQGVKLFTPAEPEKLVEYLERASAHFKKLATSAQAFLPSLRKAGHTPEHDSPFISALASLEKIRLSAPATKPEGHKATKPKLAHGTS